MRFSSGLLLSTLLAGTIAGAASADMTSQLAGTWTLKAAYDLHKDGSKSYGFGPHPQGTFIVDERGRYSLQIYRSNEPTSVTDDKGMRKDFQPNEIASTHFGHVSLDPAAHTVTFNIELAYFQRWDGTSQVRPYTLSADELSYQVPPQPGSDSVAVSVWQRVKG